ncbi:MAG: hypothetical protein VB142_08385, partial [Burkholderia sp.]
MLHIDSAAPGRQIPEPGFEVLDLAIELPGLETEVHVFELVDQRLQAFDLLITRSKLLHHFFERGLLFFDRCLLLEQQGMELGNGIRKWRMIGHASQFISACA